MQVIRMSNNRYEECDVMMVYWQGLRFEPSYLIPVLVLPSDADGLLIVKDSRRRHTQVGLTHRSNDSITSARRC